MTDTTAEREMQKWCDLNDYAEKRVLEQAAEIAALRAQLRTAKEELADMVQRTCLDAVLDVSVKSQDKARLK